MRALTALLALLTLSPAALAQEAYCVPGNPLYDRGDYRCFNRRPRPTRARTTVRAHVEAARHLSGGALPAHERERIEEHFDALRGAFAEALPSLSDERGGLHTPDVRLAVVLLPSGSVGRVRVLTRHADPLDRRIASALAAAVSEHGGTDLDGAELEVIVRLRPQLQYTRYRPVITPPCCVEVDDDE